MTMRPKAVSAGFLFVATAFLATFAAVAGPAALAFGLLSQLIFLLPGVLIVRAIAPGGGWLAPLAFGPLVGQALGSFVLTLLWVAGGRGPWLIIVAPVLLAPPGLAGAPAGGQMAPPVHRAGRRASAAASAPAGSAGRGPALFARRRDLRGRPGLSGLLHRRLRVAAGGGDRARERRRPADQPVFQGRPAALLLDAARAVCRAVPICECVGHTRRAVADSLRVDRRGPDRVPLRHGSHVRRAPVGRRRRRGLRGAGVELRGAVGPLRLFPQQRPARRGEEPQHRRRHALVFPGHPDRRPAAAAVLSAASRGGLWDRHDWLDHDRATDPAG